MHKSEFIKIINEEISDFDFLGNDANQKEVDSVNILRGEDFQKQFICDSLLNKNVKLHIFDSSLTGDWENEPEDTSKLILEYFLNVEYKYDQTKEPVKFDLNFDSDNITISKTGWHDNGRLGGTTDSDVEPSGNEWINKFNWHDINVTLNTSNGDDIEFIAFKKAPPKIQALFIRHYTESYIVNYTKLEIHTPETSDNIQNTPYC